MFGKGEKEKLIKEYFLGDYTMSIKENDGQTIVKLLDDCMLVRLLLNS